MGYINAEKNRIFQRAWQRKQRIIRKQKALERMGNKCVDCGNSDPRVLQIDHIVPILRKGERNKHKVEGCNLLRRIAKGIESLDNLALRCANCHQIKTFNDRLKFANYIHSDQ